MSPWLILLKMQLFKNWFNELTHWISELQETLKIVLNLHLLLLDVQHRDNWFCCGCSVVLLLLLLNCFSHVRLGATPQTVAHQTPPSLGFSRQEHWSGLPFPSPMHESEKWKWSRSVVSDPQRPHRLQPSRLLRPWDFPGKSTGVGCHCLLP